MEKKYYPCPRCHASTERINGHGSPCAVSVPVGWFKYNSCSRLAFSCDPHNSEERTPWDKHTCPEHKNAHYNKCECGEYESECECSDAGWKLDGDDDDDNDDDDDDNDDDDDDDDNDDTKDDGDAARPNAEGNDNAFFNAFGVVPRLIDDNADNEADNEADGVVGS